MIKEKELNIKIVGRNLNYYKNLGYVAVIGQEISIKIEDIQKNSHITITAICDKCGKERNISIYAYNKNLKTKYIYCCNECKQSKIEETNLQKYNVKRPIQNKNIYNKLTKTNLEKYGVSVSTQNTDIINKVKKSQIDTLLKKYDFLDIKNIKSGICTIECDKHHIYDINFSLLNLRLKYKTILCPVCNPISSTKSGLEIQFKDYIESLNMKPIYNCRSIISPLELDVYIPELKLAFEFNGLYWHNELNKDKNYHLNKTEMCEKIGIQLIHIYEDDWKYKQDIIKSMILNKLGKSKFRISARKCEIKEIFDNNLVKSFLESNHIQGYVDSILKIGLFYMNELVSLMTFNSKEKTYELLRFCNKLNTNVVGGVSKLFKNFINNYNPTEIITYSDRSFSQGKIYETLGFNFVSKTDPNYYYIVDGIRQLEINSNKYEHDIMLQRKIYRIYDSGNLKFKLQL